MDSHLESESARLIPEEKKDFETVLGDSIKAHGINNDLPGHLIEPDFLFPKHTTLGQGYHIKKDYNKLTESAYKEFEGATGIPKERVDIYEQHYKGESPEPQENHYNQAIEDAAKYIDDRYARNGQQTLLSLQMKKDLTILLSKEMEKVNKLKEEISQLKAEVLKEKFPEN